MKYMNKNRIFEIAKLTFLVALFIFGVGYVLADWVVPTLPPTGDNAPAPINVSAQVQIRDGPLTLSKWLWLKKVGTASNNSGRLFVDDKVGIGLPLVLGFPSSPTADLDVNGQIRIRGGCPVGGCASGQVLKAVDGSGLAHWEANVVGISSLKEGFGIDLGTSATDYNVSEITDSGFIRIADGTLALDKTNKNGVAPNPGAEVQDRVTGECTSSTYYPYGAISAIGNTGQVSCRSFVTTVAAGPTSGLILTLDGVPTQNPVSGPVSLAVNVGVTADNSGLLISGNNIVKMNVATLTTGDGLTIDTASNRVQFESCGNNETWRYNTALSKWECYALPTAPATPPGNLSPR